MMKQYNHLPGSGTLRVAAASRILAGMIMALVMTSAAPATAIDRYDGNRTLSGSYLAGRFAARHNDSAKAADFYLSALRKDPGNVQILRRAFLLEVSAGRMERAKKLANRLVREDQANALAHMVVGLDDIRARRYAKAEKHFENSAPHPIGKLITQLLTAWVKAGAGSPQAALKLLDSSDKTDGFGIFRSYQAALIADLGGLNDAARKYYKDAYSQAGSSLRIIQSYGRFLERTGDKKAALKIYRAYQKSLPGHPLILRELERAERGEIPPRLVNNPSEGAAEALFGIASATADQSGMNFALRYAQLALHMRPKFPVGRILLAGILEDLKNYKGALAAYRAVDPSSPLKENADLQVAENLDRLKRTDEAQAFLEKLAAKNPDDAQIYLVLGNILRGRSKFAEAATAYSRAVDIIKTPSKRDWRLFYFRGISYERTKRWPLAERDLKQALKLNPDQPSVLNYLGYSWIEQRQNITEALKILTRAVDLRPDDGYIIDSLGWAQYQLGRYDKAVRLLERAVDLRPDDPVINDHLGDAYWRVDRRREAKFQWAQTRDLKPEPDALKEIIRKISEGLDPVARVKVARAESVAAGSAGQASDAAKVVAPAPAPAEKVAGKVTPEPDKAVRYHVIQEGESLWIISKRYFGVGMSYKRILKANSGRIRDPDRIKPGLKLIIPDSD